MFKKIAITALLATLMTPAFAADKTTFYAGVDIGSSKINDVSDKKTSFGGFAGYQINDNFALEGAYRNLGSENYYGVKVDVKQTAISLIATMPVGNDFSIFVRVGYNKLTANVAYQGSKASDSDSGSLYGVGVSYNWTPTISSRLEFHRPASDLSNIGAAIVFKF